MRGKDTILHSYATACGITPACAGKRHSRANAKAAPEDHPRVCGEKPHLVNRSQYRQGSPPRVRGKDYWDTDLCMELRITPACAGKSARFGIRCCAVEDHPRVCGEKELRSFAWKILIGSPPRVRGKGCALIILCGTVRITPACAGKRFYLLDL